MGDGESIARSLAKAAPGMTIRERGSPNLPKARPEPIAVIPAIPIRVQNAEVIGEGVVFAGAIAATAKVQYTEPTTP